MKSTTESFGKNARDALADRRLQRSLPVIHEFRRDHERATGALPGYAELKRIGRQIREHSLANVATLLTEFEQTAEAAGARVHWAADAEEARRHVLDICAARDARRVVKAKSMVTEEVGLRAALQEAGYRVWETDIGEYVLQLADEPPGHVVAPALHKGLDEIDELFATAHGTASEGGRSAEQLVEEGSGVLREQHAAADVGITGANFLVAETGSVVLLTNEGNADLATSLPRCHIVVATLEKVVRGLEDASLLWRLLSRAAGQEVTTFTSVLTGPGERGESGGPEAMHIVLVDNGRSDLLGGEFHDALRCVRCGACMDHCPIYESIGGQAYGWVYPGPIGAVVTPGLTNLEESADLPQASTLCGVCEEVCPVDIPLPSMLQKWRRRAVEELPQPARSTWALALWRYFASRPKLYRLATSVVARLLYLLSFGRGTLRRLPLLSGWTASRDLPAPEGQTFQRAWRRRG